MLVRVRVREMLVRLSSVCRIPTLHKLNEARDSFSGSIIGTQSVSLPVKFRISIQYRGSDIL